MKTITFDPRTRTIETCERIGGVWHVRIENRDGEDFVTAFARSLTRARKKARKRWSK